MAKFNANLMFIAILTFLTFNFVGATSVSCTFDSDLCGWHIVGPGKFRWKRGSGMTDDRSSGPINDHTCANYQGNYMFISGGDAESINDIAVLESKQFNISKETAFTFWYTMNGYGSGSLTLTIIADNKPTEVWKIEGRQGKDWLNHSVTLKPGTLKLQFKSTVRIPVGSDLAIDDLHLLSESIEEKNKTHCKTSTTTSTTTTTQSTTTSTTTTSQPTTTTEEQKNKTHKFSSLTTYGSSYPSSSASLCSKFAGRTKIMPGTCDFENDTCGNKIIASQANREVTWVRTDKMEGNKYQDDFILGDHTFQSNGTRGKYLLFKNSWGFRNPKRIASVETPAIYATFACVTFWYSVPSKYSNLKVLIRDYTGRLTTLWEVDNFFQNKRASNMTGWHKQILSVFEDPPFTVVFQAYNNHHLAKVGLDDIKILGANISTGITRPASDKTTPVISLTPGTTANSTQMSPGTTKMFKTTTELPKSTKQAASLTSVKQTPPISQNKISTSNPHVRSTEKGHKKSTVNPTKKPTKINDKESDTEKQSKEEENYGKTSTVVGGVVGVLLVLILIIVIAYAINDQKHRRNRLTQTQEKLNGKHHQNSNGKVSNGALNSEVHLHVDVDNEKPKSNGHATTINETTAAFCVNTVYSNLQHSEQMNGNVNFNNLPPLTTDITEMSVKL